MKFYSALVIIFMASFLFGRGELAFASDVAQINFVDTSVYSTTSPNSAWTDIDISAVTGATTAIVWLEVTNTGANNQYAFRPNGSSVDYRYATSNLGVTTTTGTNGRSTIVQAITDSAGIIELYSISPTTTTVKVKAYLVSTTLTGGGGTPTMEYLTEEIFWNLINTLAALFVFSLSFGTLLFAIWFFYHKSRYQ